MSETLKPCATCGAQPMYHQHKKHKGMVCCPDSLCPNKAIMPPEDWNRRATTPIEEAAFKLVDAICQRGSFKKEMQELRRLRKEAGK